MAFSRILRTALNLPTRQLRYRFFSEDEVSSAAAAAAASASNAPSETVFSRILNKELPADIVHEDDKVTSFVIFVCCDHVTLIVYSIS